MDPTWQQRQPEDTVRGLLARALDDLRQARDRLNQNPSNSSRPPGSMEPWRRGGAEQGGAQQATASHDEAAGEPAPVEAGKNESDTKADSPPQAGAASAAPRGAGKPPGAEGFGRTQRV